MDIKEQEECNLWLQKSHGTEIDAMLSVIIEKTQMLKF
jgi:hypothetical protein